MSQHGAHLRAATGLETPLPLGDEFLSRYRTIFDLLGAAGETPIGQVLSMAVPGGKAPRGTGPKLRAPQKLGLSGARIPEGQQSGLGATWKVPRFRSPHGTFVKHQKKWWRMRPFDPEDTMVTLEDLGPGVPELGQQPLRSQTVALKDLLEKIHRAKVARARGPR